MSLIYVTETGPENITSRLLNSAIYDLEQVLPLLLKELEGIEKSKARLSQQVEDTQAKLTQLKEDAKRFGGE